MSTQIEACSEGSDRCNQPNGHGGAHGIDVGGGLVIAPFFGTGIGDLETVDLGCWRSSCQGQSQMRRTKAGGGIFTCTVCDEEVRIGSDGSYTSISVNLWPPNPTREQKFQFLESETRRYQWVAKASWLCGVLDADGYSERLSEIVAAVLEFREAEGLDDQSPASDIGPLRRIVRWLKGLLNA